MAQADADIDTEGVTPKRLKVRRPQETAEEPIAHNEPSTGSGIGEACPSGEPHLLGWRMFSWAG